MSGVGGTPLSKLMTAIREFQAREDRQVALKELRSGIDALESEFCVSARSSQKAGEHLVSGNITADSWVARTCNMSVNYVSDRLGSGEQLESLPKVKAALGAGEIGYQSVAVLSHLRDKLGEKR